MCGISGFVANQKIDLKNSLDAMAHRGPDAIGEYYYDYNSVSVGLGHRRLSIIDLSSNANQPFHSIRDEYSIIFNGEIYNYAQLKSDLVKRGYEFLSNSDTEVLLYMYVEYGAEMLNLLNGIFGFCILDKKNHQIFIARDHLGIKPIYFYQSTDLFAFASEIKALEQIAGVKKTIDNEQLTEFLLNGFIYEPDTGFKEIKKIKPGSYILLDFSADGLKATETVYWMPRKNNFNPEEFESLVNQSIREQTVSDVPLGVFFSGGVDSSIILSELRGETHAFVVKASEEEYQNAGMTSDYDYATKIAKIFNTDLEAITLAKGETLDSETFLNYIDYLSKATEEPIADFTFIASLQLSRETKKRGYTVMLSGMGADELFGGYPRYKLVKYDSLFSIVKPLVNLLFAKVSFFKKKIERFNSFLKERDFIFRYTSLVGVFSKKEVGDLLISGPSFKRYSDKLTKIITPFSHESNLKKAMVLDLYGFLSHNFMVADKSSMLASQELRVPLATKDLFEMGFTLPDSKLISLSKTKLPLRKMLLKNLPSSIVNRRKAGFNPPMDGAVNDLGKEKALNYMERNGLFTFLNKTEVERVLNDHFSNRANNTYKIFQLLYISSWYNTNK